MNLQRVFCGFAKKYTPKLLCQLPTYPFLLFLLRHECRIEFNLCLIWGLYFCSHWPRLKAVNRWTTQRKQNSGHIKLLSNFLGVFPIPVLLKPGVSRKKLYRDFCSSFLAKLLQLLALSSYTISYSCCFAWLHSARPLPHRRNLNTLQKYLPAFKDVLDAAIYKK